MRAPPSQLHHLVVDLPGDEGGVSVGAEYDLTLQAGAALGLVVLTDSWYKHSAARPPPTPSPPLSRQPGLLMGILGGSTLPSWGTLMTRLVLPGIYST